MRGYTPHDREARLINLGVPPRLADQASEMSPKKAKAFLEDNGFDVESL